jgi:hypothetical protein
MIRHSMVIYFTFILLLINTGASCAASSQFGNGSNTNSFGKGAPATENTAPKEANPILYENYQQCYASLISDIVGRPQAEVDARKATIKKYCRAISMVKYQKRFSDCFNSQINSGNNLDSIISDCVGSNEKPQK